MARSIRSARPADGSLHLYPLTGISISAHFQTHFGPRSERAKKWHEEQTNGPAKIVRSLFPIACCSLTSPFNFCYFIAVFNNVSELPFSSKIKISVRIELACRERHMSVKKRRIRIILSVLESHELRLQEYVKIFVAFQVSEKSADVGSNSAIHHAV